MNGERYFCAANTAEGFVSFYPELTKRAARVFIIKGGPGTGKSRFLFEIAKACASRGQSVEYYYCSSDPLSLDAVTVGGCGKILFLDGTPPHSVEPSLPGAKEDIINLGAFWDPAELIGKRPLIERLNEKKAACFARGYAALASAGCAVKIIDGAVRPALLEEKLCRAAERAVSGMRSQESTGVFSERNVAERSFGMRGEATLDTLEKTSASLITVADRLGTAKYFLSALLREAKKKGLAVTVSRDPLAPSFPDALRFDGADVCYSVRPGGEKAVNMRRFLDETTLSLSDRAEIRAAMKLRDLSVKSALAAFGGAAEHHFALERLYGSATDFEAKEEYTANFIDGLLSGDPVLPV